MVERKKVSLEEQETSVSICPLDKFAVVYSCVPATVKKLYKYAEDYPDACRVICDDGYGVTCEMPVEWISYKPRKKRVMSEEQKRAAAERLANYREKNA